MAPFRILARMRSRSASPTGGLTMSRFFVLGGVIASALLIIAGIGCIAVGAVGRSDVANKLEQEQITGSPDMTPQAIAKEAKAAGLRDVELPTCSVADEPIDTGAEAKCFAEYMRIHSLEATGGKTYAQMPRFATANGKGTNDEAQAKKRPDGSPVDNPARTIWVTETALGTALNTSYFAQQVALFSIVMGVALLLTGIGFLVLTLGALRREGARGRAIGGPVATSA
jgi:hypothetical protein